MEPKDKIVTVQNLKTFKIQLDSKTVYITQEQYDYWKNLVEQNLPA